MGNMEKQLCQTHHLFYNGLECPLCREEKIKRMAAKYVKKHQSATKNEKQNNVTEEMLGQLKDKFGFK